MRIIIRDIWGVTPPVRKYFRNFRPCGEILFAQNRGFFRNFRDVSTHNTPKITFYCIFINKFPKNFNKNAKNFRGAFGAASVEKYPNVFGPSVESSFPPFEGSPPPNISDNYSISISCGNQSLENSIESIYRKYIWYKRHHLNIPLILSIKCFKNHRNIRQPKSVTTTNMISFQ